MAKLMFYTSGSAAIESCLFLGTSNPARVGSTTDPKQPATLGSGVLVGERSDGSIQPYFLPFWRAHVHTTPTVFSKSFIMRRHCENHAKENLFDGNLSQQFEVAENLAGAQHHAAQRVVSDAYRQPRFFPDSLVQVFQRHRLRRARCRGR